jgi:cytoskeleton protein RodZ
MSEDNLQLPEQNYGPGNVLRAKREEYEWSVEAVAEALHLSTYSVKAIEADRYEDLPGATYVIGYWRSYARLLGIDIEETIEVNKRNLNIVTAEAAGLDVNRAFKHKSSRGGKGWFLLLIILGGLAYYAWQQQFFGLLDGIPSLIDEPMMEDQTQSTETKDTAESSTPKKQAQVLRPLKTVPAEPVEITVVKSGNIGTVQDEIDDSAQTLSDQPASGLVLQTTAGNQSSTENVPQSGGQTGLVMASSQNAADPDPNGTTGQNLLQAQTTASSTVPADTAATQSTSDAGNLAPMTETPSTSSAEQTNTETSNAPQAQAVEQGSSMTLTLSKDSWLDIRDKTNKRLLYKTESAGKEIVVKGTPPFYVYIGTPDGVTVRYKGKDVPFETHKSGLFARFKLGDETLEPL